MAVCEEYSCADVDAAKRGHKFTLNPHAEEFTPTYDFQKPPYPMYSPSSLLQPPLTLIRGRAVWAQYAEPVTHNQKSPYPVYSSSSLLQQQPLTLIGGRTVWAQYAEPTAHNQGTLVVFNLDITVSSDSLKAIFQQYGDVKEVREMPSNKQIKFVEFFDVRDADRARVALDGQEIGSAPVKVQFSHSNNRAHKMRSHLIQKPPRQWKRDMDASNQQAVAAAASIPSGDGGILSLGSRAITTDGRRRGTAGWELYNGNTGENSSQFAFDEDEAESNNAQARTTVMIRNIPNKYSLQMLLEMLDSHCKLCNQNILNADETPSAYDFVYLPIDFRNKCNLGYAFVNFTSAKATLKLYRDFHMHSWAEFKSNKICEITYAKIQGRTCLEDHFRNTRFACDTDEYLPLVFDPPRNGQDLGVAAVIGKRLRSGSTNKQHGQQYYGQRLRQNYNNVVFDRESRRSWHGQVFKQAYYRPKIAEDAVQG